MEKGMNGKQRGKEHVEMFRKWLSEQTSLPGHGGKPNKTEIAKLAGIGDRQRFSKSNGKESECTKLLNEALTRLPVVASKEDSDNEKTRLENRIKHLETQNDKEMAENFELKRKLKKLQHIERMMEEGKRYTP